MSQTREEKAAAAKVRMAELAAKFVERTAGELDFMRAQLAKLSAGELQALADIRLLAHRMGGTGATLGFETLADCALRVEKIADAQAPDTMPAADVLLRLATAFDAIGVEIDRLTRPA